MTNNDLQNIHKNKKSLKIPKGQSESVYRRRTDNTIPKEKVQQPLRYQWEGSGSNPDNDD
jgi:hypothetical protein